MEAANESYKNALELNAKIGLIMLFFLRNNQAGLAIEEFQLGKKRIWNILKVMWFFSMVIFAK